MRLIIDDDNRIAQFLRKRGWQYAYTVKLGMYKRVMWRSPREDELYGQGIAYNLERENDRIAKLRDNAQRFIEKGH